jgi:hypothetical protein
MRVGSNTILINLLLVLLAGLWPTNTLAQVRALKLGIAVNSPYGLAEPWATIREALERCEGVDWVSEAVDSKTSTCELRTSNGRVPDTAALARAIRDSGAGASLRFVEVTLEGELRREGEDFVLRIPDGGEALRLQPLTSAPQAEEKVKPPPLPRAEREAFATLVSRWKGGSLRVRVVGLLVNDAGRTTTERYRADFQVRKFVGQVPATNPPTSTKESL